jgi:DinB superfamily
MKSIELIRFALQMAEGVTTHFVKDLSDNPMLTSTSGGKSGNGNHAIWTLGHLCVVEGNVPWILFDEPNPVERWRPLFNMGSECSADPSIYPSFDELLKTYRDLRARNLKMLDDIGEAGLDRIPKMIPPGFENEMKTFGHTLMTIAMHNMMHVGQIADIRRLAGLKRNF